MDVTFNATRDDRSLQRNVMRPGLSKEAAIRREQRLAALQSGMETIASRVMWVLVAIVCAWDIAVTLHPHYALTARLF